MNVWHRSVPGRVSGISAPYRERRNGLFARGMNGRNVRRGSHWMRCALRSSVGQSRCTLICAQTQRVARQWRASDDTSAGPVDLRRDAMRDASSVTQAPHRRA